MKFIKYTGTAAIALMATVGSSCSKDDLGALRDNPGDKEEIEYTWAATADSLHEATYNTYLSSEGTYKQDNAGNSNFNYWWNAHMLDVLLDGYIRTAEMRIISPK